MKITFGQRFLASRYCAAIAVLALAGLAVAQTPTQIAQDKTDLRFVSRQMNVPVEGKFRKVTAEVVFDPAKPETAKARIEVDISSIDLGLEEAQTEVQRPLWFNTAKFPTASFVSGEVKPLGGGKYQVAGKLTIKGITRDVSLPLTIAPRGGGSEVAGVFVINRLDYKIGEGEWTDTETVANEVQIKFKTVLGAASK